LKTGCPLFDEKTIYTKSLTHPYHRLKAAAAVTGDLYFDLPELAFDLLLITSITNIALAVHHRLILFVAKALRHLRAHRTFQ